MPVSSYRSNAIRHWLPSLRWALSSSPESSYFTLRRARPCSYIEQLRNGVRTLHQSRVNRESIGPASSSYDSSTIISQLSELESQRRQTRKDKSSESREALRRKGPQQSSIQGHYKELQDTVKTKLREEEGVTSRSLYEALLRANTDCWYGSSGEVAKLLEDMVQQNYAPDSTILHSVLKVLSIHPDYLLRQHVLNELRQRWFSLTHNGWHDLIAGLIRERQIELALNKLHSARDAGVEIEPWLCDTLIYCLCSIEEFDEVAHLLQYRLDRGEVEISPTLWFQILDTASQAMHYRLTLFVFNCRVRTSYLNPSIGTCTNMLSVAARQGDIDLATSVFDILSRRSNNAIRPTHYDALLETYLSAQDLTSALTILTTMQAVGCPITTSCTRALYVCLRTEPSRAEEARKILYRLRDEGRAVPLQAINVLIEVHISHGALAEAMDLYGSIQAISPGVRPNLDTYNILLKGCLAQGSKGVSLKLVDDMTALQVVPDRITLQQLSQIAAAKGS